MCRWKPTPIHIICDHALIFTFQLAVDAQVPGHSNLRTSLLKSPWAPLDF